MRFIAALILALTLGSAALAQSSAGGSSGGGGGGGGPATQSGAWNVGITGTLPAFAATPTFNVGTIAGIATDTSVQAVRTALGSPFQAGASIGNTGFAINGTLPAFAATPTVNLGTLNGAATAANQTSEIAQLTNIATRLSSFYDAAGTAVPAGQTLKGPVRDAGVAGQFSRANAAMYSSQAGTLTLAACMDSSCTTVIIMQSITVGAGTSASINYPLVSRYWQVQFASTSASSGNIFLGTSQTAN